MKIIIEDLKTNTAIDVSKMSIEGINIGHKITVNYLDKDTNLKTIEGVICSIHHVISSDCYKAIFIKIY